MRMHVREVVMAQLLPAQRVVAVARAATIARLIALSIRQLAPALPVATTATAEKSSHGRVRWTKRENHLRF